MENKRGSNTQKKIDYHEHDTPRQGIFPDDTTVASANECTGLMYRTPVDDQELESYQELSAMAVPKGAQNGNKTLSHRLHQGADSPEETKRAVENASGGLSSSEEPT